MSAYWMLVYLFNLQSDSYCHINKFCSPFQQVSNGIKILCLNIKCLSKKQNGKEFMIFLTWDFVNPILPRSLKWMFVLSCASSLTRTRAKALREHLAVEDTTKNEMMPSWSVWKVKSMLILHKACFDIQKNWKSTRRPLGLPFMKILL